ncbi:MAG: signal peptide peptidase SppA [FCB group bacterium]|nr:signal peptide peptidase SppA [FCB group bacterium]
MRTSASSPNRWVWILLGGIAIVFLISQMRGCGRDPDGLTFGSKVAIVTVNGPIMDSETWVRQLAMYDERSDVKAIVLRVNSPGGGVAASQEIFAKVGEVNQHKPVVVSMGSVAASGGYYIALRARIIMANRGSVTGSIGVIMEYPVMTSLMEKIGLEMETVKSGPLKDAGSPTRPVSEEDRAYFQDVVGNLYEQFVSDVATYRQLPESEVKVIADGRVYTGVQALELGLVDTLGTFTEAIALAGELGGITGTPKTVRPVERKPLLRDLLLGTMKQIAGEGLKEAPAFRWQWRER